MSLFDRIWQTQKSLHRSSQAQTAVRYVPRPGDVELARDLALLVIDVQQEFCDPKGGRGNKETREVSQRIRRLIPAFRKAGVPVYAIYFSETAEKVQDIDFYEFRPKEGDFVLCKNDNSAFKGCDIDKLLAMHHRKTLLTCGFNLNACLFETAVDARAKGYDVRLLRDLSGNDNNNDPGSTDGYLRRMTEKGVIVSTAADELRALAAENSRPRAKKHCRPRARPVIA